MTQKEDFGRQLQSDENIVEICFNKINRKNLQNSDSISNIVW